ncbi:hypothetical protein SBRCBS47491_003530 [Sporothrix bragantina]|uniref:Uncharacterized protein n=1 Tax=Sporothrix bragantina TaxID=671064 RepID=A0ABP0BFZ4_9PEZI
MKFMQLIATLFLAAVAQAAVADVQRGCTDRCLEESNECARRDHREHRCEEEFHRCEERCHHEHEHHN